MHVELQEAGNRLVVRFDSDEELAAALEKADAATLVLRLETRLDEGSAVVLDLASDARQVELRARVKQVFRSGVDLWGTLLEVQLEGAKRLETAAFVRGNRPEHGELLTFV